MDFADFKEALSLVAVRKGLQESAVQRMVAWSQLPSADRDIQDSSEQAKTGRGDGGQDRSNEVSYTSRQQQRVKGLRSPKSAASIEDLKEGLSTLQQRITGLSSPKSAASIEDLKKGLSALQQRVNGLSSPKSAASIEDLKDGRSLATPFAKPAVSKNYPSDYEDNGLYRESREGEEIVGTEDPFSSNLKPRPKDKNRFLAAVTPAAAPDLWSGREASMREGTTWSAHHYTSMPLTVKLDKPKRRVSELDSGLSSIYSESREGEECLGHEPSILDLPKDVSARVDAILRPLTKVCLHASMPQIAASALTVDCATPGIRTASKEGSSSCSSQPNCRAVRTPPIEPLQKPSLYANQRRKIWPSMPVSPLPLRSNRSSIWGVESPPTPPQGMRQSSSCPALVEDLQSASSGLQKPHRTIWPSMPICYLDHSGKNAESPF
jgi:hypothetical protein